MKVSEFVSQELRGRVSSLYISCLRGETCILPRKPNPIFSQEELNKIGNSKERLFYSYFSSAKADLPINFEPNKDFDYMLVGIYFKKNGLDEALSTLLERRPELFIFLLENYFDAFFSPFLPLVDFVSQNIETNDINPLVIDIDGEVYDCLTLAEKLHNSPLLRKITFYMSEHHEIFMEEIMARGLFDRVLPEGELMR